jgi:uncharacterized protein (UPF0248 family)
MAQLIDELLNKIRWNEDFLNFKYEIGYMPKGTTRIDLISFEEMEFGEKDTEAFKLKATGRHGEWIPFDTVVDVYKNGLLLWHKEGVSKTFYTQEEAEE